MYGGRPSISIGGPLTPMVKKLMIINAVIFVIQHAAAALTTPGLFINAFGLSYQGLFLEFKVWQVFTYMFLHGGLLHLFFNLLILFMFAGELERVWGSKAFLKYYIYSGLGAGIFISLMNFYVFENYQMMPVTIGASGALYAILLAYGLMWPDREVLLYFLFPVKIKYLLLFLGLLEFFGTVTTARGAGGNISHIGHVGGLISGFIILFYKSDILKPGTGTSKVKKEGFISSFLKRHRNDRKKKEIENRIKAKKIIDKLLEKIAREGMSSLTPEEKRDLEWARKNFYPGGDDTLH